MLYKYFVMYILLFTYAIIYVSFKFSKVLQSRCYWFILVLVGIFVNHLVIKLNFYKIVWNQQGTW